MNDWINKFREEAATAEYVCFNDLPDDEYHCYVGLDEWLSDLSDAGLRTFLLLVCEAESA